MLKLFFSALRLFVGQQEGDLTFKKLLQSQKFSFEISLHY